MRTALAYTAEDDEVSVVSTEGLEANVIALRSDVKELKTDFKDHKKEFNAAVARLDSDIKASVSELRAEIRAVAAKAANDLKQFADRVEAQFAQRRADDRALRDRIDKNHAELT